MKNCGFSDGQSAVWSMLGIICLLLRVTNRVTRLGEFSTIGRLLTLDGFFKITTFWAIFFRG
jgi:hypothetical protein